MQKKSVFVIGEYKSFLVMKKPGNLFSIKMLSKKYKNSHYKDKTVSQLSHLHNGSPFSLKTALSQFN